jgi:small subunit ribosomal protein S15
MALTKEVTAAIVAEYGKDGHDTGSAEVQVALASQRIKDLTAHLKMHPKDNHTRRGLLMLIGKRRKMLRYIMNRNIEDYRSLIKKLGIRDTLQSVK